MLQKTENYLRALAQLEEAVAAYQAAPQDLPLKSGGDRFETVSYAHGTPQIRMIRLFFRRLSRMLTAPGSAGESSIAASSAPSKIFSFV